MYNMHLTIGPCQVHLETDERLSFDGIESLLNRSTITVLTLFNAHMAAMVKYDEVMYQDHDCEACELEEEINNEIDPG